MGKWTTCATYNTSLSAVLEALYMFVLSLGYDRLEGSLVLKHKDSERLIRTSGDVHVAINHGRYSIDSI